MASIERSCTDYTIDTMSNILSYVMCNAQHQNRVMKHDIDEIITPLLCAYSLTSDLPRATPMMWCCISKSAISDVLTLRAFLLPATSSRWSISNSGIPMYINCVNFVGLWKHNTHGIIPERVKSKTSSFWVHIFKGKIIHSRIFLANDDILNKRIGIICCVIMRSF